MQTPARFCGKRTLPAGAGASVVEVVVRVGDLEARALVPAGERPTSWTVRRAGRWTREGVGLDELRRGNVHRGRLLATACARMARAA